MELLHVSIPAAGVVIVWAMTALSRLRWEQYQRREANYRELLGAAHGFYSGTLDSAELKFRFLRQIELAWLYAPDEVIRTAYRFLDAAGAAAATLSVEERDATFGAFVCAVRDDLLSRRIVSSTELQPSDFRILAPRSIGR